MTARPLEPHDVWISRTGDVRTHGDNRHIGRVWKRHDGQWNHYPADRNPSYGGIATATRKRAVSCLLAYENWRATKCSCHNTDRTDCPTT